MALDNLNAGEMAALVKRIERLERAAPIGYSSVSRGALRIASDEGLIVEGSAKISGVLKGLGQFLWDGIVTLTSTFTATGTALFTGPFTMRGTTRLEGDTTQVGALHVVGNQDNTGTLTINGLTTLLKRLTVTAPGDIRVGGTIPMTIGNATVAFDSGGSVAGYAGGVLVASGGAPNVVVSTGGVSVDGGAGKYFTVSGGGLTAGGSFNLTGAFTATSKSFLIEHPSKPGLLLRHGSTEGPTHGVEYHGTATFDTSGVAVVELPDYFEALTLTAGRTVQATPCGAPFPVGAGAVADGTVTLFGEAGRSAYWLVKADRELFEIELAAPTGT